MSAISPRSRRLRRRRLATVESLEARAHLAAQPTAVADAYTVVQGQTLSVSFPRNEFHTDADNYHPPGPRTWTEADGHFYATSVRTGFIRIHGEGPGGDPYWDLEFFNLSFDQPLAPGYYAANTQATAPGVQTILGLHESGVGGTGSPNPAHFTIYDLDITHGIDGDTVNRFHADFVINGIAEGYVYYSTGPHGVLGNDPGPADVMTASLVTGPAHGTLSLNPDGTFSYTPDPSFAGTDSFTYAASDGTTTSAAAVVTLNVVGVNQPPSFTRGPDITVPEDSGPQSINQWATNISPGPYAFDAGQSVSFVVLHNSNPALFSQAPSIDPTGKLTCIPAPNAYGSATLTLALYDSGGTINGGQNASATQTFAITLTPVNDAPILQNQTLSLYQGQTTTGSLAWSDDSPTVTITTTTPPAHGTLSLNPNGSFTYTPAPGFVGTDSFQVVGSDGSLTSAPATVALTVQPAPTAQFTGTVLDVYDQPNGSRATPLVGRAVFDDANGNGQVDPGEATAVTDFDGRFAMTLPVGTHTFQLVPKAGWVTPDGYGGAAIVSSNNGGSGTLYTTMADPVYIDVLAVHPAPVTLVDFTLPWDSAIRNAFAAANAIFANSDTNIRLNLVAIDSVKYTPANNLKLDLARLYTVGDGALDTVPRRRDLLQADLAILFDAKPDEHYGGMAPILNPAHPDASRGYAVVVASNNAAEGGAVLAHEIGHTLGADHDVANGPRNFVPNAHGYRFTGNDGVVYHDVMAYPPGTELPFFSSPNLSYAGHALGTAAGADAARVVRENAYAVASYRGPVVSAPASLAAIAAAVTKSTAKAGDAVTAKATVRNNAVSKFSGKFAVAYYLSKDKTLDASDVLIKRTSVTARNLAAKGTLASSVAFKVDAKLAAGTYYVLAVATPTGKVADERAAKAASVALKVAAPPKKKAAAKVVAAGFQSARPIAEQATGPERRNGDPDDVITGLLLSSK